MKHNSKNIQYINVSVLNLVMTCKVVSYTSEQNKCNLVMIPGYSLTSEIYEGLAQVLCSNGFTIYIIDCLVLREIKLSVSLLRNKAFFRPAFYADCLHQVIGMLGLKEFSVITNSMASHITLKMLEKDCINIRSLYMLNPSGMTHSIGNIPFGIIKRFPNLLNQDIFLFLLLAATRVKYFNKLFISFFRYLAGNPVYKSVDLNNSINEIVSSARTFQSGIVGPLYLYNVETLENFDFNILTNIHVMLIFSKNDRMLRFHAEKINGKYVLSNYSSAWFQRMKSIEVENVEIDGGHEVLFEQNSNGNLARKLLINWLDRTVSKEISPIITTEQCT